MIARDHHYLFSHVHLRNQALRNPEQILSEVSGPMSEGFLFFLWGQVEDVASEPVSAVGLRTVGVDTMGGGSLALLQMPPPERDTESIYVGIFTGPAGARYFVFDQAVGAEGEATLAELEVDETRINLGRHPATMEGLLSALAAELSTPAPSSIPPAGLAPTMAMPSVPPGPPSAPGPSSPGAMATPLGAPFVPGAPNLLGAPPSAPRSNPKRWILPAIGLALAAPLFCCLGTSALAYDSGLDEAATFEVSTALGVDGQEREQLVIRMSGPEDISSFRVEGPGAEGCSYLSRYGSDTCTIDLGTIADPAPEYRVVASGHGPRFFGEDLGDRVELVQPVAITRPLGLRFSESQQTTVVRGFPGRFEVTQEGFLRLVDAPAGTTLGVGSTLSTEATPTVPLDVVALTRQVGVLGILRDGGRVSVSNVTVRLPDGTTSGGTAQLLATHFGPALARRLEAFGDTRLGEATGSSTLWLADGELRAVFGQPSAITDIGRIVVSTNEEVRSGSCGPYSLWGIGYGSRIPRTRWRTEVVVYDRVNDRRVARRSFSGDRPDCPYTISQGTRQIHGVRDTSSADEYARGFLAPPEEG
jgi:hypothetical protein